ncbi:MAG: glutamate 5-kinase, partial [Actinomycetota bacterium]|nr:glutamate 5-kinase [Actinomycetota bacterium]
VVVKLGTSLVVGPAGRVRRSLVRARASELAELVRSGTPVCVVSSGAIALGLPRLGTARRPRSVPRLQAASALGQARLQSVWEEALGRHGTPVAQILLTAADIADRVAYVNARRAFGALFRVGAVPVVNENDATATDEITFGDNDALAAQVAVLVGARLLVLLTEVEGIYTAAPGTAGAELITEGARAGEAVLGAGTPLGSGGMRSKVVAATMAGAAGIPAVIASGRGEAVLPRAVAGDARGTHFEPAERRLSAFKLWLRFGKPAVARLRVDDGARRAVAKDGRSLLAVGVVACDGRFEPGDAVEIADSDGIVFAKGIAGAPREQVAARPRDLEVVHRDRLVVY